LEIANDETNGGSGYPPGRNVWIVFVGLAVPSSRHRKTTVHIVVYRYPRRPGLFSLPECSDTRRIHCDDPHRTIISVIRAGEVPEVIYGSDDPSVRERVDRLKKQVESGKPLSGGPLIMGQNGEFTAARRSVAGRLTAKDDALAIEVRGAFDPPIQFSLKRIRLTREQEDEWLKKLCDGDRKGWVRMATAARLISRSPRPWSVEAVLHELHGTDIDTWSLEDRFGKDPRVIGVPVPPGQEGESIGELWDLYRRAHPPIVREDENGERTRRELSTEERKKICLEALVQLHERCPNLPSEADHSLLEVLLRRVRTRGGGSRAAFQTPRSLSAALTVALLRRKEDLSRLPWKKGNGVTSC